MDVIPLPEISLAESSHPTILAEASREGERGPSPSGPRDTVASSQAHEPPEDIMTLCTPFVFACCYQMALATLYLRSIGVLL